MSREDAVQEGLEVAGIVAALVAGRRALRAAPLPALTAVGLAGLALATAGPDLSGLALGGRAETGAAAVARWQDRQAGRIVCRQRATHALRAGDPDALAAARRSCERAR